MANELPDWMKEEDNQPGSMDSGGDNPDEEIENGQLLKANDGNRFPTEDINRLLGQFAGLRQVKAAELVSEFEPERATGGNRVLLNDREQLRVTTFENLIGIEGQQKPVIRKKISPGSHPLRIVAAIALISAVLLPQLLPFNPGLFAQPDISSAVIQAFHLVEDLPPQKSVLVAVDFEPGYSGEMTAVATPVLKHLLTKDTRLTIISTTPTGPVQSEILMTQSGYPQAVAGFGSAGYLNFGYLPGGQVGLQHLVQSPGEVLSKQIGQQQHEPAPANREFTLQDFDMVIVVSDRLEVARNWIEQVRPTLGTTPTLLLLSSQVKPTLSPYLGANPGQIQGLIAGLADGYAYDRLLQKSSNQPVNWASYNLGLVVAVILIAAAGARRLILSKYAETTEGE